MQLIDAVADVVTAAGRLIEEVRASAHLVVSEKGGQGPVTEADRRSDELLRSELGRLESAAWLSEETADDPQRLSSRLLWVVDPLDGTKEFIAGIPEYAVSVALAENGHAVLGVIHNPASGETFSAVRGRGATLDGRRLIAGGGSVLLASRSEMKSGEFRPFEEAGFQLRAMGSIAYKLACIAGGRAAMTLSRGPKWEWDVCAGALLVTEAGGRATDVFGDALLYNRAFPTVRGILAGDATSHERARQFVSALGASDRMAELTERSR
jgi:myo-inositol-1(or 4)-monophosphatase